MSKQIDDRAVHTPGRAARSGGLASLLMATTALLPPPALGAAGIEVAQAEARFDFDIPARPLAGALDAFSRVTGWQVGYASALAEGRSAPAVRGSLTPEQALRRLLAGSGLDYRITAANTVTLERTAAPEGSSGLQQLSPITVEGANPQPRFGDAPPEPGGFKADYQVSATKSARPIRETPQAIGVVPNDLLRARQAIDLSQALETVAGVAQYSGAGPFAGRDAFGYGGVQIRGIDTDYLVDTREDGFSSPVFSAPPDLAPYERIEVVKGPSSTLYGRGSAGGFINRVRKKPLAEPRTEVAASVGSYDFRRLDGDVTGPLFDSARARGRLVAAYEDAGAFVDNVESTRVVLAPSLEVELTGTTRLLLQTTYQQDDFIHNPGVPLRRVGGSFVAPDIRRSLFVGVPNTDEVKLQIWSGTAQLDQEIGENWLATLRLYRSASRNPVHIDSYAYGINAAGDVNLFSGDFQIDSDVWSGELRLNGDVELFGRPATLTAGIDHTKLENANDQAYAYLGTANVYAENFADVPTVTPALAFGGRFERSGTGVYAQLDVRPVDRLRVLLGGRYDRTDTSSADVVGGTSSSAEDEAFTGRAGLVFDLTREVSVYGLYARSFNPVLDVGPGGQVLAPEEGEIFEAGVKSEWLGDRLAVNLAVFRLDRSNVPVPVPGMGNFSTSSGLQRSDGIELDVNGEPLPGWNLSFAATLLDSEFIERDDPNFGNLPAGASDWQVGLYTSYQLQEGPLRGLGAGVGLYAVGERGLARPATLEGYERVDVSVFYNRYENVDLTLQVRNVLDERYIEGADRPNYAQFGAPTAVLATGRLRF